MCTKTAIIVQMTPINEEEFINQVGKDIPLVAEFQEVNAHIKLPRKQVFTLEGIKKEITERTAHLLKVSESQLDKTELVSEHAICVTLYSPSIPNLTLVDLPGTRADDNSGGNLHSNIKGLITHWVNKKQRTIRLALEISTIDLDRSDGLSLAYSYDITGYNTIGVITKLDQCQTKLNFFIAANRKFPFQSGYFGVCSRPDGYNSATIEQCVKVT